MDINTVLHEVDFWPIEEQIRLAQALWDRIVDAGVVPELTEVQRIELDRRLEDLDAHPDEVIPWDGVQEYLRRVR
jgi:putative addiction module component (TIGR02574 family)